ncbi:MAG TPA: sialidase family protein [Ktedonobacterales bacterium]|nr:sialidase family protein [Ktedonobacterales bacterium]
MTEDGGSGAESDDEGLVVESLEEARRQRSRSAARRVGAEAARALWERWLNPRQRLLRGGLIVALLAATLFALLGGPSLMVAGWQRLSFALRSGTLAPKLEMTAWRTVRPPPGVAPDALTYAADPADPQTALACQINRDGITLWRSDDLGATWLATRVTQDPAQSCQIKAALDASTHLLLVARTPDPTQAGCQRMAVYLSASAGYQWAPVALPSAATGAGACQGDAWTSARWVFAWWTDGAYSEPTSSLMRSADGGATWQQADGGLPTRGAYLAPALTAFGSGGALLAQVYYWPRRGRLNILRQVVRSLDSGATWATVSREPPASALAASLEPRLASAGDWGGLYAPIYTDGHVTPPWVPDSVPEAIQRLASGAQVWSELPPLPVSGATADDHRMGVASILGVAPANVLLTLGVDPHKQVTERQEPRDLWLWAWDPQANEWRLGLEAPPNAQLVGFTWSAGPVGSAYEQSYGAYLWLTGQSGGHRALFSAFIPVPSAR